MHVRSQTASGHGWLDLRASASATRKFVYDPQAQRVRLVERPGEASRRRSLRWLVLALALGASAFGLSASRADAQPRPSTPAPP